MATRKIKIISRLRPKIQGELDDDSVKVVHSSDESGDSLRGGGNFITVQNPRDPTQIFKFLSVNFLCTIEVALYRIHSFSSCYDQDSTQEEIYCNDVDPLLDIVYTGVVCSIFFSPLTL